MRDASLFLSHYVSFSFILRYPRVSVRPTQWIKPTWGWENGAAVPDGWHLRLAESASVCGGGGSSPPPSCILLLPPHRLLLTLMCARQWGKERGIGEKGCDHRSTLPSALEEGRKDPRRKLCRMARLEGMRESHGVRKRERGKYSQWCTERRMGRVMTLPPQPIH